MSRPLADWEMRLGQYGPQLPTPQNQYELALVREQRQSIGKPLTTGQKISREIAYFVVGGAALKGLQVLNWSIKGARGVTFVRNGRQVRAIRDIRTGRFITRGQYRGKEGLYTKMRMPDRIARTMYSRVTNRIARTPAGRLYARGRKYQSMYEGPKSYLFNRYAPREVRYGVAGYGIYRWVKDKYPDLTKSDGVIPGSGDRVKLVFNTLDNSGERLPPIFQKSFTPHRRSRTSSSRGRCPPGHRWSSKARKCVPLRRKRS